MMNLKDEFTVTEDHLKLAKQSYFSWRNEWGYTGAAGIGEKRPYGNSAVVGDIIEILGWEHERNNNGDYLPVGIEENALKIHMEMDRVFQIAACTLKFETGTYKCKNDCDQTSWERVDEPKNLGKYRTLEAGEEVLVGDEFFTRNGNWEVVSEATKKAIPNYKVTDADTFRRPIPQYRPFAEGDIIEDGDQWQMDDKVWMDYSKTVIGETISPELIGRPDTRKLVK